METFDPEVPISSASCLPSDPQDVPGGVSFTQTGAPGHGARELSAEELQKLQKDTAVLSDFKQAKLEREAKKNWDLFYKRNTTKFFKDRHWTTREFSELCGTNTDTGEKLAILEVGCGVGNFVFPLIQELPNTFFYACDFSPRAVQFVKDNELYNEDRCNAFQCDLTTDPLTGDVPASSVDIVTMIFVLSAIHPEKMVHALQNIASVLKPGGCVLFRDYGLYDHAMLRFTPGHKLSDNFYVRQDGTRAFFFSKESLEALFSESGFEEISNEYITRETVNRKEGLCVPRVFVQGKFRKVRQEASDNSSAEKCQDLERTSELSIQSQNTCNDKGKMSHGDTLKQEITTSDSTTFYDSSVEEKLDDLVISETS